jgi:hypothetical protein
VDRQAGVIYVAYQALGANKRKSIMFTRSIDRGRTWSAPTGINDTPNNYDVFSPALAVSPDGQHVTVEFYDQRNQTTNSLGNYVDLYLAESFDGGNTWQPNLRLSEFSSDLRKAARRTSDAGAFLGEYQAMVPSANLQTPAVAAWIDTRAGNNDPYSVRIARTTGTSFDAWRRLRFSTNDFANAFISGEQADPDGDGLPNLAEYALGREPARVDAVSFTATRVNDGKLSLSFERLAVLGDIQFSWQTSTNLVNWVAINPTQEIVVSGRDPWMERVTDSFTPGEGRAFYRLGVKLKTP